MNKVIYNQLSEKLYNAFCQAKLKNEEKQFVEDLIIDEKIVTLFEELYKNEETSDGFYIPGIFNAIKAFFPQTPNITISNDLPINEKAKRFAIQAHREVDQLYGDDRDKAPYEYHLWMSVQFFHKYKYYIPLEDQDEVEGAQWCHDVVEDGHRTFNNVKEATSERVALIACACTTNLHGINRKARADADYYNRINSTQYADFVKLCDRFANVSNGGKMIDGYKKEMPGFLAQLPNAVKNYPDMVRDLKALVGL